MSTSCRWWAGAGREGSGVGPLQSQTLALYSKRAQDERQIDQ